MVKAVSSVKDPLWLYHPRKLLQKAQEAEAKRNQGKSQPIVVIARVPKQP